MSEGPLGWVVVPEEMKSAEREESTLQMQDAAKTESEKQTQSETGMQAQAQAETETINAGAAENGPPSALVALQVRAVSKLNLADFQNAVPALQGLDICNGTASRIEHLTLQLVSEPAFVKPRTWRLDAISAGETRRLADLDVQLEGALLSRLTEAEPAVLRFALHSRPSPDQPATLLASHDCTVELLARNQWGGLGQMPAMVAAFVQPNDPAVDRLLKGAALVLQAAGKSGAIDGYGQGPKRVWELASAVWSAVLQKKLHYALPPASFEHTGQKVRSPGQLLDAGLATCLDLALLFAACLEQANLNPVLVFTRGHAFVGVWLNKESFDTAVVDDATAVRKRLKLQEMLVFETTLAAQGQPVRFSQAIAQGNRQLADTEDAQFERLVDIRRARMARIRPLALAQAGADPQPLPEEQEDPFTIEEAPDLPDASAGTAPEVPTAELDPKDRLARWQRKLLDLSLRNALLNFKQGKKSLLLEVAAPPLEDAVAEGRTLKLLHSPELMDGQDPRSQALHEARSLEDLRSAHAAEALGRREVFVRLQEEELETRLVELFRGARSALQEGGANTLFVALGFLVWARPDKPELRLKAPLILLPVTLGRKSARAGFTLQAHEDEAVFNPTLVEMLRQDFQLELGVPLGDLQKDHAGLDIAGIWTRVRTSIRDVRGWEVSEDVVLSMFSFAKYLMWKDLSERTEDLRKSPVVAHLLDTPREPFRSSIPFPQARQLDREFPPEAVFSPLPADSSQLSAVMAAARGKDFVLIGPPGTGKSQTIANLIAQCLAEGKRVLFVAEKIAALDVVYRRLREVGLGEFCLELHSSKSRKLDVLSQLHKSWDAQGTVDAATWKAKAQQLAHVREQLSTYVERLHRRHGNGLTIFRAIGSLVGGKAQPELAFGWSSPHLHDEAALAQLRELAGRLRANASAVGAEHLATGPLSPLHATDWSVRWQQDMVLAAEQLQTESDGFATAARQLGEALQTDWPVLHRQARAALAVLASALPQAAGEEWSFCALPDNEQLCEALQSGVELLAEHQKTSAQIPPAWPAELQQQMVQALDWLEQHQRLHTELGTPWPTAVSGELERGLQCIEEIKQLRSGLSVPYGAGVLQLEVAQLQRAWAKAEKALWPLSWLGQRKVRSALEAVAEGTGELRVADDLAALVHSKSLREEVSQMDPGADTGALWAGLKTRTEDVRSALQANAALQAARHHRPFALGGLAAVAQGCCGERWAVEARRLQALHALDQQLAGCAQTLSGASQGLWRGHGTDVALLRSALAFECERLSLSERGGLLSLHPQVEGGRCGALLQQAHLLFSKRSALEARASALDPILGNRCAGVWKGLDTQPGAVQRALQFHASLQTGLAGLALPYAAAAQLRQALHRVLSVRNAELADRAAIGQVCRQVVVQLDPLQAAVDRFSALAAQPPDVQQAFADLDLAGLATAARQVQAAYSGLHAWCAWRNAQAASHAAGIGALADAIAAGTVEPAQATQALEVNYARWWLGHVVDEDEVLKRFVSAEHGQRISAFRALDEEFTVLTRQWIRARLCADLPSADSIQRSSEWGVLRREITKKRQHLPLRQLLVEIPSVVLQLAPCLLMSPLSIAQYLSASASNFDIVIFDEASQIPVWDAIGAMARGRQVVMVGDPKQLPPTNFFGRAENADDDAHNEEGDLESILDECLGASLPTRNLSWHYRSRHESLIAFSNHRYYDGKLVTFPSPATKDQAVSFHWMQGRYEKGGARTNQIEAKALVADLVGRLRSPGFQSSGLTVGVVTFNAEQQGLIEDLLDAERRKDPGLEPYFSEEKLEPVFVKNLESVQGDERDIMYFSITYGPDTSGTVSMNFGPLNRDGGERRLNVAVTRARHELRVFSSLRGDQMDLSRTKAHGVRDLKHFLEFAERGPKALAESHRGSQGDFDSPFESGVAEALARKGWQVHTQIGASAFRIDLGVVHPDFPGRYLAGVECDGATYHSSATARDRDKLREQVLRGLGWEILRIWSTDWWVNPGGTLERIHLALTQLLENDRSREQPQQQQQQQQQQQSETDQLAQQANRLPVANEGVLADPAATATAIATATATATATEAGPAAGIADAKVGGSATEPKDTETLYACRVALAPSQGQEQQRHPVAARPGSIAGADGAFQSVQPEQAADAMPANLVLSAEQFHLPVYDAVLQRLIDWVVAQQSPMSGTDLARRIARMHGFQRTGSRIQERVEQMALQVCSVTEGPGGCFYLPKAR